MNVYIDKFRDLSRKAQAATTALVLTFVGIAPILVSGSASAAPALASRTLTTTSAIPAASAVTLAWTFNTTADVANIDHIQIEFCDAPLTSCSNANGDSATADTTGASIDNIPFITASPSATLTGFPTNTVTSTTRGAGLGGGANNQINIQKTTQDAGASITGASISIGGFTNDNIANRSYYTRMRLYNSSNALTWEGVFAQSTSQTLTVNARVQERLDFCVGSTSVDDATTTPGAACANISGTTVDIGNVESGQVNISPVLATNGGNNTNGIAMVRTNAVNGVVVDYKAVQNSSSGTLKVPGATCAGPTSTGDQCFNVPDGNGGTAGTPPAIVTAGSESFGMTIAGVNCGSNTAYVASCDFATGLYNLVRDANYDGDGTNVYPTTEKDQPVAAASTYQYHWIDSGVATRIASSAGSTVKVVDDEALILKFAATAGVTTPTGSYSVQADYIATTTF